ncbi:MAG: hypothetical protein A3E82_07060 [Gammaproteobacteria bacterium RIFCSPHIGHO2_12_FULL_38_11]|nr:MAG: hypothetical protein A3E82_07060 [Gammaproteobacteria bacterium RIFCSPHIGHO2_12_FULL_38_11]
MNIRTLVCTLAGLLAVICLVALAPRQVFTSKGIILPAEHVRSAISPHDVSILQQAPEGNFQSLGQVHVELGFNTLSTQTRDQIFQKVKILAASVGANTVIINLLVPDDGMRRVLTFIGTAIYIPHARSTHP